MISSGLMNEAIVRLNDSMKRIGREVNAEEVAGIVQGHALMTAASAAASGAITGVGSTVAIALACTSTIAMYGRLGKVLGVRLNNGLIRTIGSAVVADLAAAVAANIALAAAVSFIPGVGNMASATLTMATNYGYVYLAGVIFIKMVAAMGISRMETMSAEEMKATAKSILADMDVKSAMKEAKCAYKASK